jgi:hypothetical protein
MQSNTGGFAKVMVLTFSENTGVVSGSSEGADDCI